MLPSGWRIQPASSPRPGSPANGYVRISPPAYAGSEQPVRRKMSVQTFNTRVSNELFVLYSTCQVQKVTQSCCCCGVQPANPHTNLTVTTALTGASKRALRHAPLIRLTGRAKIVYCERAHVGWKAACVPKYSCWGHARAFFKRKKYNENPRLKIQTAEFLLFLFL